MASKKLAGDRLEEFKKLVLAGKTPEEIKDLFGISVSSVHNYKQKLKDMGVDIPDVRGKRPTDVPKAIVKPMFKREEEAKPTEGIEFVVNGVKITISGPAKAVDIDGKTIVVEV